jgi:NADH:ubiquinone oxidoreductase subunit F (NADH-binding)
VTRTRLRPVSPEWTAGPAALPRLLRGDRTETATLGNHVGVHGPLPRLEPDALIAAVERAGLRGRGGGGFPTATKLRAVARQRRPTVVLANGCEGEPASTKDRLLVSEQPHLVLDGVALAASAVGATETIVAVERTHRRTIATLQRAARDRANAGLDAYPVRVVAAPARYVAGEESALVHWINGGPAKPTAVPPRVYERGVAGRPTLVQNVETLAHLALIARHGDEWFRLLGTRAQPGSTLITLSGAVARPGVCEIAHATSIDVLFEAAGGTIDDIRAVLVGGYFGTWINAAQLTDLRLTDESLRDLGAVLGCGAIVALGARSCGVVETARVLRYLAEETAGQCGPCVYGLGSIADAVSALAEGRPSRSLHQDLARWTKTVANRGACHHPDGALRLLSSARRVFTDEIALHKKGRCSAPDRAPVLPLPPAATREWGWR